MEGHSSADNITAYQLDMVVKAVDRQFGEGFAQRNPGLVGECMRAAALNRLTTKICEVIRASGGNQEDV